MTLLAVIVFTLWSPQCPYRQVLCDSIWVAEGGHQARVPYGVLSQPVRDTVEARLVCLESIDNSWTRWQRAGRPGGNTPDAFIAFFAKRWCPPSADPVGHRNLVRNLRNLLRKRLTPAPAVAISGP